MIEKGWLHMNTLSEIALPVTFSRSASFQQIEYRSPDVLWGVPPVAPRLLEVERDLLSLPRTWDGFVLAEVDEVDALVHENAVSQGSMAMLQQGIDDVRASRVHRLDPATLELPERDE